MKRKQKLALAVSATLGLGASAQFAAAATAYTDNFDRATLNGGTYVYNTVVTAGNGGALTDGSVTGSVANTLSLTNDLDATANASGIVYTNTPTSAFTGFDPILSNNSGDLLTWTLNMQQPRTNPSGFGAGNYGAAYVLGATDAAFNSAGSGYALVVGNTGTADPIRLYRYENGLAAVALTANSSTAAGAPLISAAANASTSHWSVKVTYNAETGQWSLSTRDDTTGFADPATDPGSGYLLAGTSTDATHTDVALTHSGAYWAYSTQASQVSRFDNLTLDISDAPIVLPPRDLVWDADGVAGANPSDGSGNWADADHWYDPAATAHTTFDGTRPDNAVLGAGSGAGAATVDLGAGGQNVGRITFAAASPTYTLSGGTILVNGYDTDPDPGVTASQGIVAHQSATIGNNVNWLQTSDLVVNGADSTLTINGQLQGGGRIDKKGDGTVVVNGVGTGRSGTTSIQAGTLRITSASMSGGVPGTGTGALFPQSGGTLHLDASGGDMEITSPGGIIHMGVDAILRVTGNVTYRRNYPEFISNDALGPVSSTIHVDEGGLLLYRAQLRNDRTTTGSLHTIKVDGPGTVKLTNSGSNGAGDASIFSGSWDLSNGKLVLGQNTETGGSSGDTLNALGFKNGDSSLGNTITVRGTGVLVGTENTPNPTSGTINAYKADVIMSGGTLASGNGKDSNWGGPFTTTAGTTSTIAVYDPLEPATSRSVSLTFGSGDFLIQPGPTTWGGNLVIDPGTTTGGAFNITRDGGTIAVTPGAEIQVMPGAGLRVNGVADALSDGTNHVNIVNNSTITGFQASNGVKNVGNVSGSGDTTVDATGELVANHLRQNAATINGKVTIRNQGPTGPANGVSNVGTLALAEGARLDLKNNKLVTNSPVGTWDGAKYTGIQGEVARAYDFGAWDLPGIMTSEADAGPTVGKTTIAVGTGEQALFLAPNETGVFAGQTISGTTAIAMYTWAGDLDLNGVVDAVDYGTIDQWIQFPGTTGYTNGDLNYDGVIDAVDYGIIDNGIQLQGEAFFVHGTGLIDDGGAGMGSVAAVPEPASGVAFLAAAASLFGRRRKRNL